MKRLVAVLGVVIMGIMATSSIALAQSAPHFILGFKALADQVPDVVGSPTESEHWGDNGDSLQQTTTGLMVWRKADNWTAFTNGSRTWINGPAGVQERGNDERFAWEEAVQTTSPSPTGSQTRGTLQSRNGKYEGEIRDGERNGIGTFTWENNDSYTGAWKDGKADGQGVLHLQEVGEYSGSFTNGKRHGQGAFAWIGGDKYEGAWADDLMNGSGKYTFADGARFEGKWVAGQMHGQGTYWYADGTAISGRWENNKLVEIVR